MISAIYDARNNGYQWETTKFSSSTEDWFVAGVFVEDNTRGVGILNCEASCDGAWSKIGHCGI